MPSPPNGISSDIFNVTMTTLRPLHVESRLESQRSRRVEFKNFVEEIVHMISPRVNFSPLTVQRLLQTDAQIAARALFTSRKRSGIGTTSLIIVGCLFPTLCLISFFVAATVKK